VCAGAMCVCSKAHKVNEQDCTWLSGKCQLFFSFGLDLPDNKDLPAKSGMCLEVALQLWSRPYRAERAQDEIDTLAFGHGFETLSIQQLDAFAPDLDIPI
jgi:hypothetical protein